MSVFGSACGAENAAPVQGTVFQAEGNVMASPGARGTQPRLLSAGNTFSAGEEIYLAPESSVALCLVPGIYLRGSGSTRVRIGTLEISKNGNETGNAMNWRQATVHLDRGRIHVSLPSAGTAQTKLTIVTDTGSIVARSGALLSVARMDNSLQVLCVRGEIKCAIPPGTSTSVTAGYFWQWKAGAHGAAEVLPASENAEAQTELASVLESSEILTELETQWRNAPAPWRKR